MSETLICVADDVGIRVWLERVLESEWSLECVTSSDLSRVSRLVQVTGAPVVIVAVEEHDPARALKTFAAVQKACPGAQLVGVAQRISQDLLLNIMQAGARDCLITGVDSDTARERVRRVSESSGGQTSARSGRINLQNITVIVSSSPVVDTRFFAQNLASEINHQFRDQSVLAIDTLADENRTFYFDSLNRLTLNELMERGDSIDRSFIETALDEYAPGLRLLSGNLSDEALSGDSAADLFITTTQLAELFASLIIRVDYSQTELWLKAIGADVSRLILVTQPVVDQIQNSQALVKKMQEWMGNDCQYHLVVDGYEKRSSLSLSEVEKTVGLDSDLSLPIEWRHRLDSINAGIPVSLLPSRSAYQRKLDQFVRKHYLAVSEGRRIPLLTRTAS